MRIAKINMLLVAMIANCFFFSSTARGQGMAVNATGSAAAASAILDVSSTTQGMLVPRMTNAQVTTIATPATGLLVYQTDGTAGFYFYNGSAWAAINSYTNVTTQGNTFNGAGQLVQADGSGHAPNGNLGSGSASSSTYLRGDQTWQPLSGGSGTVNSVSSGNLAPFTSSVSTASTTPSISFSLSNAAAYTVFTNSVSATGAPAFGPVVPQALQNLGGTANATSFYRGDGQWAAPCSVTTSGSGAATFSGGVLNLPTSSGGVGNGVVDLIATMSSAQTIGTSTTATLQYNSVSASPSIGSFNTGTYTYTVGATGNYLINVNIAGTTTGQPQIMITVNGTTTDYGYGAGNSFFTTYLSRATMAVVKHLTSGDQITVVCQNSTSGTAFTIPTGRPSQFAVVKL